MTSATVSGFAFLSGPSGSEFPDRLPATVAESSRSDHLRQPVIDYRQWYGGLQRDGEPLRDVGFVDAVSAMVLSGLSGDKFLDGGAS